MYLGFRPHTHKDKKALLRLLTVKLVGNLFFLIYENSDLKKCNLSTDLGSMWVILMINWAISNTNKHLTNNLAESYSVNSPQKKLENRYKLPNIKNKNNWTEDYSQLSFDNKSKEKGNIYFRYVIYHIKIIRVCPKLALIV